MIGATSCDRVTDLRMSDWPVFYLWPTRLAQVRLPQSMHSESWGSRETVPLVSDGALCSASANHGTALMLLNIINSIRSVLGLAAMMRGTGT